jgi:hypothetical protein
MKGFAEFEQFYAAGFPAGTQVVQVRCVYQFRHARTGGTVAAKSARSNGGRRAGRKQFFFEKKNQKTLTLCGAWRSCRTRQPRNKSFLVLFFKKELLPFLCA